MLITFQFPIADARPFSNTPECRLHLPDWDELKTDIHPQFVHHFGEATERYRDPDAAWPDEMKFVDAKRGLRFDRLETRHAGQPFHRFRPKCAFRRLFCDGQAVVRIEVGLTNSREDHLWQFNVEQLLSIIKDIAEIPTHISTADGDMLFRPILLQGKGLSHLFASVTTNLAFTGITQSKELIEAGNPFILVELSSYETLNFEHDTSSDALISVDPKSTKGVKAHYCKLNTNVGVVSTWILDQGKANRDQLRNMRLCLSRLHAEREVLDLILKQIKRKRLLNPSTETAVNDLDEYFNNKLFLINKKQWAGIEQSGIISAFDAAKAVIRPALQSRLTTRYEGGRRQVWSKIKSFEEERRAIKQVQVVTLEKGAIMVEKNVYVDGTGNIVNIAEYMSNVTNTVNNNITDSSADTEIKDLIKQLGKEISRISQQEVDPTHIKKMGKNLTALSEEITNDEPERRWYEVSLEGLKEAAQAVGAIASPVIAIVNKLKPLLLS